MTTTRAHLITHTQTHAHTHTQKKPRQNKKSQAWNEWLNLPPKSSQARKTPPPFAEVNHRCTGVDCRNDSLLVSRVRPFAPSTACIMMVGLTEQKRHKVYNDHDHCVV